MGKLLAFAPVDKSRPILPRPCAWYRPHRWTRWDDPRRRWVRYWPFDKYGWEQYQRLVQERRCGRCGEAQHRMCGTRVFRFLMLDAD